MKELLNTIYNTYSNYRGSGKIPVLFLVSILVIYLINKEKADKDEKMSPLWFVLFVWGGICYAFTYVIDEIRKQKKNKYRILVSVIAVALCSVAVFMSGVRVFSAANYEKAENVMHIRTEYIAVFDRVLSDIKSMEEAGIAEYNEDSYMIAAPTSVSPYIGVYSSKIKVLCDYPVNGNADTLTMDQRIVYEQFLLSVPDMYAVTKAAERSGCSYILIDISRFYPEFKPSEFGYVLVDTVGNWEIYRIDNNKEGNV